MSEFNAACIQLRTGNNVAVNIKTVTDFIREAAAKVWAKSDQPLHTLAARAEDELILAVLIPAAQIRGRTGATLAGLLEHRPQQTQLIDAWGQAIVAMADRVDVSTLLKTDGLMDDLGIESALRLQFLSAGVQQITQGIRPRWQNPLFSLDSTGPNYRPRNTLSLVDLLISRAQVHLTVADAKASMADLTRITQLKLDLAGDGERNRKIELIAVESHLRMGHVDDAFQRAAPHLATTADSAPPPLRDRMADLFISAADMGVDSKRHEMAGMILKSLRTRLGNQISVNLKARISRLEDKIKQAADSTS